MRMQPAGAVTVQHKISRGERVILNETHDDRVNYWPKRLDQV